MRHFWKGVTGDPGPIYIYIYIYIYIVPKKPHVFLIDILKYRLDRKLGRVKSLVSQPIRQITIIKFWLG